MIAGCAVTVNLFEIDRSGRAVFNALDNGDVEVGTGDYVSPPIGVEKSRLLCSGRGGKIFHLGNMTGRVNWNLWLHAIFIL